MQVTLSQPSLVYRVSSTQLPNMSENAHMVKQTITFSDGTETVINYRGVIVDGVLISEKVEEAPAKDAPEVAAEPEKVAEVVEESTEISE